MKLIRTTGFENVNMIIALILKIKRVVMKKRKGLLRRRWYNLSTTVADSKENAIVLQASLKLQVRFLRKAEKMLNWNQWNPGWDYIRRI